MTMTLADRLAQGANTSTLGLAHYGRRSSMPYEGETGYLATANRSCRDHP